jgi:hypothetical protein
MQSTSRNQHIKPRNTRSVAGAIIALLGVFTMTIGVASSPVSGESNTQEIDLDNGDASAGSDCPNDVDDFWHFIIARTTTRSRLSASRSISTEPSSRSAAATSFRMATRPTMFSSRFRAGSR